ncbi:hypothetical protein AX16_000464 [Volvariella volvacea WC 439]|nr:hypothetical protein AX16_000464 [Volvariella volvacea WC 439]
MALPKATTLILVLTVLLVLLPAETYAFGAGDIPEFSYLHDKAYRHGDIEGVLGDLVKWTGRSGGGGLFGFASSIVAAATGGSKFSRSDIKKVYFGNWLRDYSQAMDIAGLSKLSADTLVLVVSVLGFMAFGFATEEFEVNAERLGVYLPVEHIDNPKGYAAKEGDARRYHPKLRPPVSDRELEIDERTGMKCYMATEDGNWDTSTAHIRRVLRQCIEQGRSAGGQDGPELHDAYRNLGSGLHTLEDLLAHSNWCELALRKMGYEDVFCHVGDNVIVETPNGPAPPLVTGTFGGADFLHSLMGEATDKISQASVTDLTQKMNEASQGDSANLGALRAIISKISGGGDDDKMEQGEQLHAQSQAYHFDPDNVAPPEVQQQFIDLVRWRDGVYRDISAKIEKVPGLASLLEEFTNALNAYVFTVIAPYVTPLMQQTTGILDEGSMAVIDSEDQYEVFDNPNASDPSHSLLSKDHFGLILNEPAGQIAQIVVRHTVSLIVRAWSDDSDPDSVIDQVLEAFHHPYYASGRSQVQNEMFQHMENWIQGLGPEEGERTIQALSKESVREGKNKRLGSEEEDVGHGHSHGGHGGNSGHQSYGQEEETGGSYDDGGRESYYQNDNYQSGYRRGGHEYGGQEEEDSYRGGSRNDYDDGYGSRNNYGEDQTYEEGGYRGGYSRHDNEEEEGGGYSNYQPSYSRGHGDEEYGSGHSGYQPSYGGGNYGGGHSGYQPSYNYGGGDDTYGMDRLNVQDDYGDRESYETRHHRTHYGESSYGDSY